MFKYTQFDEKNPVDLLKAKQKRLSIGFGLSTLFSLACWSFTLVFFLHQSNQVYKVQCKITNQLKYEKSAIFGFSIFGLSLVNNSVIILA